MAHNSTGWWQQAGFGRQFMDELQIDIEGKKLRGSGRDIVAPFRLNGQFGPDGSVSIVKQYEDLHSVLYVGYYDGEGTFSGEWDIRGYRGKWSIKLHHPARGKTNDITDILPN